MFILIFLQLHHFYFFYWLGLKHRDCLLSVYLSAKKTRKLAPKYVFVLFLQLVWAKLQNCKHLEDNFWKCVPILTHIAGRINYNFPTLGAHLPITMKTLLTITYLHGFEFVKTQMKYLCASDIFLIPLYHQVPITFLYNFLTHQFIAGSCLFGGTDTQHKWVCFKYQLIKGQYCRGCGLRVLFCMNEMVSHLNLTGIQIKPWFFKM